MKAYLAAVASSAVALGATFAAPANASLTISSSGEQFCGFYATQTAQDGLQSDKIQVVAQWGDGPNGLGIKVSTNSAKSGAQVNVADIHRVSSLQVAIDFAPTDLVAQVVDYITYKGSSVPQVVLLLTRGTQKQELFVYDSNQGLRLIGRPAGGERWYLGQVSAPEQPDTVIAALIGMADHFNHVTVTKRQWYVADPNPRAHGFGPILKTWDVPGATGAGATFLTQGYGSGAGANPVTDPFHVVSTLSHTDGTHYWTVPLGRDGNGNYPPVTTGTYAHPVEYLTTAALGEDVNDVTHEPLVGVSNDLKSIYTLRDHDLSQSWTKQTLIIGTRHVSFGDAAGERFSVLAVAGAKAQLMAYYRHESRFVTPSNYSAPSGQVFTSGAIFGGSRNTSLEDVYLSTASSAPSNGKYARGHVTQWAGYSIKPVTNFQPSSTRPGRVAAVWSDDQRAPCDQASGTPDEFGARASGYGQYHVQASVLRGSAVVATKIITSSDKTESVIFDGLKAGVYRLRISTVVPWMSRDVFSQSMTIH